MLDPKETAIAALQGALREARATRDPSFRVGLLSRGIQRALAALSLTEEETCRARALSDEEAEECTL